MVLLFAEHGMGPADEGRSAGRRSIYVAEGGEKFGAVGRCWVPPRDIVRWWDRVQLPDDPGNLRLVVLVTPTACGPSVVLRACAGRVRGHVQSPSRLHYTDEYAMRIRDRRDNELWGSPRLTDTLIADLRVPRRGCLHVGFEEEEELHPGLSP